VNFYLIDKVRKINSYLIGNVILNVLCQLYEKYYIIKVIIVRHNLSI
jgi:hypothetical protein